jgi:Periplasmic protein involved in polysaccharide export
MSRFPAIALALLCATLGACTQTPREPVTVEAVPRPQVYTLDSGDRLRIIVFGQDSLSNIYTVDASGKIAMPLVGTIPARGLTTQQLARAVERKLAGGYVREPSVSVDVEAYRPFFILGEVRNPGQYPFVAGMTVQTAVAIAGGFTPRAVENEALVTRQAPGKAVTGPLPATYPIKPGDTIVIKERWF